MSFSTIFKAIRAAKQVWVMVDNDYHDRAHAVYVPVAKTVAIELVRKAPDEALPALDWRDDSLYLIPQGWRLTT